MENIYECFDQIESMPAIYLGNDIGITALNHFVTGFILGGGRCYDKKLHYPDFSFFSVWLGGVLKIKYEASSMNWSWMLLDRYKDDKKALEKFFFYLQQFKTVRSEVFVIPLTNSNIQFAIEHKLNYLWCKVNNASKSYYNNLGKVDRIILFKLQPSRTLFSLLVAKDDKLIDIRNTDMTGRMLYSKIEKQFGINLNKLEAANDMDGMKILRRHKII